MGTADHADLALRIHANFRTLDTRATGRFDIAGKPDAVQLAALLRRYFAARRTGPVRCGEGVIHHRREITGVVSDSERIAPGHGTGRNQIAPPQFDAVDVQYPRGAVDQALDQKMDLRFARAAIGIDRHRVGDGPAHARMHRLDAVHRGQHGGGYRCRNHRRKGREVGAEVGHRIHAQREHAPLCIERQFQRGVLVACLRVRYEGLAALGTPLHWPTQLARGQGTQNLLGIEIELRPEAAADIARDDVKVFSRQRERLRQQTAQHVYALARGIHGKARAERIEHGIDGARLHRTANQTLVVRGQTDHVLGTAKQRCGARCITGLPIKRAIAGDVSAQLGRARSQRRPSIADCGQGLVADHHPLAGITRLRCRLRHHKGHRVANMAHRVARQRVARRLAPLTAITALERRQGRQAANAGSGQIGMGQHREHARHGTRRCGVEAGDARMGMRRAQHAGMGLARQAQVIGIAARAAQQGIVFDTHGAGA